MSTPVAVESPRRVLPPDERINWVNSTPFFLIHLMPLALFWTGVHLRDVVMCIALYVVRMFFITAGYHRYFAHRSYKLGRVMQFIMAFGGGTAAQKGALWWASHHRAHHRLSDTDQDPHAAHRGLWWSHVGWIICDKYNETPPIKDFSKYPELRFLERFHLLPPVALGLAVFLWGGWSALWCGFFLSTVILYHGVFSINSLTHRFGNRRYQTTDTSKNSFILAIITLGEGWHNNHHYYSSTANQGFFWWEIDISYYVIKLLSWVGLASDVRTPTNRARFKNWYDQAACDRALSRRGLTAPEPHIHDEEPQPAE